MKANPSKLMQTLLHTGGIVGTVVTVGMTLSGEALAQISNTKHNLTTSSGNTIRSTGTEICAFCHTPHGSDAAATGAPLWNKSFPATTGYSLYTSGSLDSGSGTAGNPGANSLACLSCHDGSQAMDTMVNAPGSGGWTATGARPGGGYTWSGATNGIMQAGAVAMLSKDLRNDHPVGIQYAGGGYTKGTAVTGAIGATCVSCVDKDFKEPYSTGAANWFVDVAGAGVRSKTDISLYTTTANNNVQVECGSCHDPHVISKAADQTSFLRVTQAGSALCLACHSK